MLISNQIQKIQIPFRKKARDLTKICNLFNCQLVASFHRKLLILHTFYLFDYRRKKSF